jgi:hypothetical protein
VRYSAYGVAIRSDLPLGVPCTDNPVDITIRELEAPVDPQSVTWLDRDSDHWMSAGLIVDDFYVRFGEEAEFVIRRDGRLIHWYSQSGPSETLVHLVLDHVLPRSITRLDRVVLHGSAVAREGHGAVAILGQSGAGKSTLAAALTATGHVLVADDAVVIESTDGHPLVTPAYPGLRLSEASVQLSGVIGFEMQGRVSRNSPKQRVALSAESVNYSESKHRLLGVFVLSGPQHAVIDLTERQNVRLFPAAASIELLRHSMHLRRADEREALMERILAIASACPVFSLNYEHSESGIEDTRSHIESVLHDGADMSRR